MRRLREWVWLGVWMALPTPLADRMLFRSIKHY